MDWINEPNVKKSDEMHPMCVGALIIGGAAACKAAGWFCDNLCLLFLG